jgi:hypothetical protein
MEPDDLREFKEFLPSRAKLGRLSLWAPTEEERLAASRMLDVMRKAGITDKEPISWADSSWNPVNMPTLEEIKLSPTGRATLELLRANAPMSAQQPEPAATVAQAEPQPAPPAEPEAPPKLEPPPGPSDDLGVRLEQERAAKRESEQLAGPVHKWVAAKPSAPDKSLRPLPPDESFSNNDPIY